jgi:hypothetical protein
MNRSKNVLFDSSAAASHDGGTISPSIFGQDELTLPPLNGLVLRNLEAHGSIDCRTVACMRNG